MTIRIPFSFIVCACVLAAPANEPAKPKPPGEEKVEGLLTSLTKRCCKMLELQRTVNASTKQLHTAIEATPKKVASPADLQAAVMLSEFQKTVITEADSAIEILEKEGTAVAFPEVFRQVKKDMEDVQRQLAIGDVGAKTQSLQKDITDTLEEMIDAVRKPRCTKTR